MNMDLLLLEVQPARAAGARDLPALETALAGLALNVLLLYQNFGGKVPFLN